MPENGVSLAACILDCLSVSRISADRRHGRLLFCEGADGFVFRAADVEDLVHADELEERAHRLGHPAQLQVPTGSIQVPQRGQEGTQPGAVHEPQAGQVEDDLPVRLEQGRDVSLELLGIAGVELIARQDHYATSPTFSVVSSIPSSLFRLRCGS